MKLLLTFLATLFFVSPCMAQAPLKVWIKTHHTIPTDGMISGTTNLPDGTIMHAMLGAVTPSSDFNSDHCLDSGGSAVFAVSHGTFGPVNIGTGGNSCLKPGTHYVLDISIQAPFMQPPSVMAIMGKNGGNLAGPLVSESSICREIQAKIPVKVISDGD